MAGVDRKADEEGKIGHRARGERRRYDLIEVCRAWNGSRQVQSAETDVSNVVNLNRDGRVGVGGTSLSRYEKVQIHVSLRSVQLSLERKKPAFGARQKQRAVFRNALCHMSSCASDEYRYVAILLSMGRQKFFHRVPRTNIFLGIHDGHQSF